MIPTLYFIILLCSFLMKASGFTFSFTEPAECDDLIISWTGGSPPFQLLMTPVFGTPRNISIPDTAFQEGKGTFSMPLPFASGEKHKLLLTMSDKSGFGTGGTSGVLTPKSSSKAGSCNTADIGIAFEYQLNDALTQCRPYKFSGYSGAIQPITIIGMIPGGNSFFLNPPLGSTSFDWTVNVLSGTSLIFLMVDSVGRQGGSSNLFTVLNSDETSCINGSSPTSTSGAPTTPTSTISSSAAPSTASSSSSPAKSPPPSTGAIAGTLLGALIFLAVAITLGLFFLKRYKQRNNTRSPSSIHRTSVWRPTIQTGLPYSGEGPYDHQEAQHSQNSINPFQPTSPFSNISSPFLNPSASSHEGNPFISASPSIYTLHSQSATTTDPFTPTESRATYDIQPYTETVSSVPMTTSQRKAAMAGVSTMPSNPRYVVHTDLEDAMPKPNEDGVVELPPEYRERQEAPSSISGTSSKRSSTETELAYK